MATDKAVKSTGNHSNTKAIKAKTRILRVRTISI
jgi:hypothetical protein